MNYMQKILSTVRRACDEYNLISDGDRIAIGVSGGKDSLALVKALKLYSNFAPIKFEVVAITIDMFNKGTFDVLKPFFEEIGVEYHIIPSNIYETVFEIRKEKNPCSLCSKLRRGMLVSKAKELNCNKLALGHTSDDITHTFLLSLLYEGRLSTISPKSYLDRNGMTVIRPLILTEEEIIIKEMVNLPVIKSLCPVDKHTKREYVKKLLDRINEEVPIAKDRIFRAIIHDESYNLFNKFREQMTEIDKLNNNKTEQNK